MSIAEDERVKEITANKFISTFLIVRKVAKEARTLKIIARISFHFAKANELARKAGSNSIRLFTLHCRKFFNAILFMCKINSNYFFVLS